MDRVRVESMTQDDRSVNTDPALIMDQIRRRVLEIANRRKIEDSPEPFQAGNAEISSLLQSMSEGISNPWREEALSTSYPFPLRSLALKIRRIIQAEIRWAIEPFIQQQTRFNLSSIAAIRSAWESSNRETEQIRPGSPQLLRYAPFEESARGSSALVKSRQTAYVDNFRGRANVLDVGCGRGEFLELLKEQGVQAYGIDNNPEMVKIATSRGLRVLKADALKHLWDLEDGILGGLFCAQVIEHMTAAEALEFVQLAFRKMMHGSRIVIETVNPTSVFALTEFFRDPTHAKPVHPNTLRFMLESAGFVSVRIQYCNEPTGEKLEEIKSDDASVAGINRSFQKLNRLLWGPMDYAAIGVR